jgi:hypothetical protein
MITGSLNAASYLVASRPSQPKMYALVIAGGQANPSQAQPATVDTTVKPARVKTPTRREHPVEMSTSAPADGPNLEPMSPF